MPGRGHLCAYLSVEDEHLTSISGFLHWGHQLLTQHQSNAITIVRNRCIIIEGGGVELVPRDHQEHLPMDLL